MTAFSIGATLIFFLAILHAFLTPYLTLYSERAKKKVKRGKHWKFYHFSSEILYFLSEIEVVFGIWLIPLFIWSEIMQGWNETIRYLDSRNYTLAIYITVILVVIGSKPIITFAERILELFARLGKDSPGAWWWAILTVGPLLGALLKEPGAMALSAILLSKKFYPYKPSKPFQYATLGLLFANVSVGGTLTAFSSRSLFIVASEWEWSSWDMFSQFGWKAVIGILIANTLYYLIFRKEFQRFPQAIPIFEKEEEKKHTPLWITIVHLVFLTLLVLTGENAPLFLGVFILFLGFHRATFFYQTKLHLKSGVMVGFFFASLLIHGELQGWWMTPLMEYVGHLSSMLLSYALSAFTDNAVVAYLSLDIPSYDDLKRYLVIAGAVSAGALTIIANAPNLIGHTILRPSFKGHISFTYLFLGALFPSLLFLWLFWFTRHFP